MYWLGWSDTASGDGTAQGPPTSAWRYDGTPLDVTQPVPTELLARRLIFSVRKTYKAQQKFGLWLGHRPSAN
jgi:hypothetical protein